MYFLLDYDRHTGKIVTMRTFDEAHRRDADSARWELELAHHHKGIDREVVLLDAADEQAVRKTHRRYFADLAELARLSD